MSGSSGGNAGSDDGRGAFSTAGEGASALSGLEIMRRGVGADRAARPGIGRSLNFWLVEVDDGRVVFEGEPGAESLNPLGIIHGGWTLTVIDSACGCATMTALEPGVSYTTLETKVNMTRAIKPNSGVYRCEGRLLARGRQIITSEAAVRGPDGKLYAHGTSTCMVLRPKD
ncbi:MAG: PaaI family thioesterase [Hyphomonadaceae bacterium]|nr:PaaI family thioesterase [Hyphomonadaceae bacterium]